MLFFVHLPCNYAENRWNFMMFSMIFEVLNGFTDHQNNDVPSGIFNNFVNWKIIMFKRQIIELNGAWLPWLCWFTGEPFGARFWDFCGSGASY